MNKAITDGLNLMPPAFSEGLGNWSSGDGTPGAASYDGAANAAYVPADQDFAGCLELFKTDTVQKLRAFGQTPILPGCYLRVTARVKAVSGPLPSLRIAGWAAASNGAHVAGVVETGPTVDLTTYGEIVEVSAIVGSGNRQGVDMVWGTGADYGHFGLDVTGPNGGVVRIDDIEIEDITSAFLRDMLSFVDVRDYGAVGDGVTDDSAAFEMADDAADGRTIVVPDGNFHLANSVTLNNPVTFEGHVTMPDSAILSLTKSYELGAYIQAFGSEEQGFRKAFQALLNSSDHESLDMGGRRVSLNGPVDMQQAVNNRDVFAQRRVIRNGQLVAEGDVVWNPDVVVSQATYDPDVPTQLSNVTNAANIAIGSLVSGNGVGREVYVSDVNVATGVVYITLPLYDSAGTQNFTFTRFKYILDFSGFIQLSRMGLEDIEFQCSAEASGVMLARSGTNNHFRDCTFTRPGHRGITSPGSACQGLQLDRCQFRTRENGETVQDRVTIAINGNGNDIKVRNCWASQFRHFLVLAGSNNVISNNHFYQGDGVSGGLRTAGLVLSDINVATSIVGNYIDNCHIEWTNEHESYPDFTGGFGYGALSITNNNFLIGDVAPWTGFIVIKPFGTGHRVSGLNVTGNVFRVVGSTIDRVDVVDTTHADLNYPSMRDIQWSGNIYKNIVHAVENPLTVTHDQNTAASTWVVDCSLNFPFQGVAKRMASCLVTGRLRNGAGTTRYHAPYASMEQGADGKQFHLNWEEPVTGEATMIVRMDR